MYYSIAMALSDTRQIIRIVVEGAVESLHMQREMINSLNLFPVPDGDTGTNMYLTMAGGLREMEKTPFSSIEQALHDFALGALKESRGNSGVILAQLLEGISSGLSGPGSPGVQELLNGFRNGAKLVYSAVQNPVEGTILTVVREMAEGLESYGESSLEEFLAGAYTLACQSLLRNRGLLDKYTPGRITPVDSIDAGGAGLVIAFEGALSSIGIPVDKLDWSKFIPRYRFSDYCGPRWDLRFLVDCASNKLGELKAELNDLGDSIVLAGSTSPYTIHIHTNDPEEVLNAISSYGSISGIEASEMLDAHPFSNPEPQGKYRHTTVIAYSSGEGMQSAFREMGAEVLEIRPEAQIEMGVLLDTVNRLNSASVVILPNCPNMVRNANDVAQSFSGKVTVIPTESPIQGLAAMEEYFDNGNPGEILENMKRAAAAVETGYIVGENAHSPDREGPSSDNTFTFSGRVGNSLISEDGNLVRVVISVCESLRDKRSGSALTLIAGKGLDETDRNEISAGISELIPEFEQEWYKDNSSGWLLHVGLE
ncbi:MAG: DAK2 domain-containing protein [Actinobacteria bacterium]|nr:DAK2 domain-containing protein [Actinomycetota bacterium]